MEFINAGLVGFVALAALPVLVHLLHRPRPKAQPFPSLIFLQRCARRSRAVSRMRNIVLMLLRAAAVAGIALALARPRIAGAAQADEGVAAAIIIDDSFRMQYRDAGRSRFDEARDRALDVLGTLPAGTQCAFLLASGESSPFLPDPSPLRASIARASAGDRALPLLPAIVDAARLLEEAGVRRRELHVFTDLARSAWSGASADSLKALAGATIYVHDVARDNPLNYAVTKIDVAPRAPRAGRPVEVTATIAAWGAGGQVTVTLLRGDGNRSERLVNVPAGGTAVARFQYVPDPGSAAHGVVRIATPDPLPADSQRFFAVPLNDPLKLLVVEPGDGPPYLSFALSPPSLVQRRPVEVTVSGTAPELKDFDGVLVGDPAILGAEDVNRIADFVRQGGGLVTMGTRAPDALASLAAAGLCPPGAAEQPLPEPVRLSPSTADHPALMGFRAGRNGDLSAPEFTRRLLAPPDARWKTVVRFADGAPAALEAAMGRGRIVFLAFALGWTDLPKHPCFVPLLHELMRHLSRTAQSERDALVGSPVIIELRRRLSNPAYAVIDLASGDREERRAEPGSLAVPVAFSLRPGRYAVECTTEDGQEHRPFAVNLDPAGSDPTRLSLDDIRKLLPDSKVMQTATRSLAAEVKQNRQGRELTTLAVLLVCLVLFLEIFVASKP